jgi:pyruvate formate lyase activating enzyme
MSSNLTRRDFFANAGKYGMAACAAYALLTSPSWLRRLAHSSMELYAADKLNELSAAAPLARYWVSTESEGDHCTDCHISEVISGGLSPQHPKQIVKCLLCAQACMISPGQRGGCQARINLNGELRSLVYGRPITIHTDPIEKKPFYHFLPGSQAYSLATSGCPLHCQFCQNWEISQIRPEDYDAIYTPPESIVTGAQKSRAPIIAFTYNEPTVFIEYLTDIARAARGQNLRSVLVSCGFMNEAPLTEMCSALDAVKIDLKGFSEDFYHKVSSAQLQPVLRSIKQVARSGVHLEIVNLMVPTLNDSDEMIVGLCDWIAGEIGPDVPVHFTRFHPDYKLLNLAQTPVATLEKAREVAMSKGIRYAYVGNVPGHPGNHTYCPSCGKVVVKRSGYILDELHVVNGACEFCGSAIAGVWK